VLVPSILSKIDFFLFLCRLLYDFLDFSIEGLLLNCFIYILGIDLFKGVIYFRILDLYSKALDLSLRVSLLLFYFSFLKLSDGD